MNLSLKNCQQYVCSQLSIDNQYYIETTIAFSSPLECGGNVYRPSELVHRSLSSHVHTLTGAVRRSLSLANSGACRCVCQSRGCVMCPCQGGKTGRRRMWFFLKQCLLLAKVSRGQLRYSIAITAAKTTVPPLTAVAQRCRR